jgi:hypothetical protein
MTPERLADMRRQSPDCDCCPDDIGDLLAHVDALTARAEAAEKSHVWWEKKWIQKNQEHIAAVDRAESAEALLEEARGLIVLAGNLQSDGAGMRAFLAKLDARGSK